MAQVAGPSGGITGTRAQQIQQYAALLDQQFPPGPSGVNGTGPVVDLGKDYITYMNSHPSADPYTIYNDVVTGIAELQAVPSTIGEAVTAGGVATGKIGAGVGAGAAQIVSDFTPKWSLIFGGFSGWFFRGVKMLFGGILMVLAVSRLTGLDNKVTQLAMKAPVPV